MTQGDLERLAGVREGDLLAGKYRVERVLGAGGMGAVVAAYHMQLETKVALKFLLPAMLANEEAVTRFAREARAAVRITNEHVARVLDVGTLESGAPYIVMEYLDGTDLAGWLRQRGPLPIEEAIDFVLQAGEAIAEAHALGIVHRDLKPANLFCIRSADGRPTIKVLDFGISKVTNLSASASNLVKTQTATLMGSPFYMSPEQMEATHAVDARTDIWALGVILFELLTGKVPFYGETVPEVSLKIGLRRSAAPSRLSTRCAGESAGGGFPVPGEGPGEALPQHGGTGPGSLAVWPEASQSLGREDHRHHPRGGTVRHRAVGTAVFGADQSATVFGDHGSAGTNGSGDQRRQDDTADICRGRGDGAGRWGRRDSTPLSRRSADDRFRSRRYLSSDTSRRRR